MLILFIESHERKSLLFWIEVNILLWEYSSVDSMAIIQDIKISPI